MIITILQMRKQAEQNEGTVPSPTAVSQRSFLWPPKYSCPSTQQVPTCRSLTLTATRSREEGPPAAQAWGARSNKWKNGPRQVNMSCSDEDPALRGNASPASFSVCREDGAHSVAGGAVTPLCPLQAAVPRLLLQAAQWRETPERRGTSCVLLCAAWHLGIVSGRILGHLSVSPLGCKARPASFTGPFQKRPLLDSRTTQDFKKGLELSPHPEEHSARCRAPGL